MLDTKALKQSSEKEFSVQLFKKVVWISNECWAKSLDRHLRELNEIIKAGKTLGVTKADELNDEDIAELVTDLGPLRTLEMRIEAATYLAAKLVDKGVEEKNLVTLLRNDES